MRKIIFSFLMLLAFGMIPQAQTESRLFRFPSIHGNRVAFTYAGDLYTVGKVGGVARKLTNDAGYEMFAHFSPDGKNIAFTAQYDGNTEVFLMPSEGGIPKRLTYTATLGRDDISDRMGPNNIVNYTYYLVFFKINYLNNLTATPINAKIMPIIQARMVTLYAGQPSASK